MILGAVLESAALPPACATMCSIRADFPHPSRIFQY